MDDAVDGGGPLSLLVGRGRTSASAFSTQIGPSVEQYVPEDGEERERKRESGREERRDREIEREGEREVEKERGRERGRGVIIFFFDDAGSLAAGGRPMEQ